MTAHEPRILEFVRDGIANGLLEDIESRHLKHRMPAVDICCGDYRRVDEGMKHLAGLRGYEPHEDPQSHLFRWHGGAPRLVPESKSNRNSPNAHEVFFSDVVQAPRLTGINYFKLRAHLPCGWALDTGMEPEEVVGDLVTARTRLVEFNPQLEVLTLLHVDYRPLTGEAKMRNYLVPPEKWVTHRHTALH
ncbi:MAG: hypothetical protein HY433_03465 [Candidatus Liptonbacteria bacterium]|nr:hypothetical protein [Candidatus Liptonbacteria bacterium]